MGEGQPERLGELWESFEEDKRLSLLSLGSADLPTFLTDGLRCQF
jgi:hypothetical protein